MTELALVVAAIVGYQLRVGRRLSWARLTIDWRSHPSGYGLFCEVSESQMIQITSERARS